MTELIHLIKWAADAVAEQAKKRELQRQQADPAWQAQQSEWERQRREWEAGQLRGMAAGVPAVPPLPSFAPPPPPPAVTRRAAPPPPLPGRAKAAVAWSTLGASAAERPKPRPRPLLDGRRPASLRAQFVLSEVLKPPLALREPG